MAVMVVTGASSGIGRETARALARDGHTVVVVGRNRERTESVLADVRAQGKGHGIVADLSLRAETRRVASEVKAAVPRLDGLLHCASIVPARRSLTTDGVESAFATNVLAPFVLTQELLPLLKASAPSRVVTFYGGNHDHADLEDLQSEKGRFVGWNVYGMTKVCTALLTVELAQRLAGTGVTVNGAWPGIVNTEGMRAMPGSMGIVTFFMRPLMRNAQQGAQTPVFVATAPELEKVSGKFFGSMFGDGRKEMTLPKGATDSDAAKRLWAECERLVA
jgi:NAD(P)-dependent dehydrogenase (short-subunit alcohol dehydrogenase family)